MSSLTIILPCYNEASRGSAESSFESRLYKLKLELEFITYQVILVDDGSTDDSVQVFEHFVMVNRLESSWRCVKQDKNQGKGAALLRGISEATTDYVLLLDSDLSTAPYHVISLLVHAQENTCYIATRYALGSRIVNKRTPLRRLISWCCRVLVQLFFRLDVSDTQCGFKLIPTDKCKSLTTFTRDSWLYDVEILYNLKCQGVTIKEFSISWENMERESTVKAMNAIIPSTLALFRLFSKKRFIELTYKKAE